LKKFSTELKVCNNRCFIS